MTFYDSTNCYSSFCWLALESAESLYKNTFDCFAKTFKQEGIPGFYKGLGASYLGVTETAIQFTLYENFKSRFIENRKQKLGLEKYDLTSYQYIAMSSVAKLIASVLTYPHEVIRTRLREQRNDAVVKYKGPIHGMIVMAKEEGIAGLYGGLGAHLIRVVPNAAILFYVYEMTQQFYLSYVNSRSR